MASDYVVYSAEISPEDYPLQTQKVILCLLQYNECTHPHVIVLEAKDEYLCTSTINDGKVGMQVKRCQLEIRGIPKPYSLFNCTFNAKPIRTMKISDHEGVPKGGMRAYLVSLSNKLINLPPRLAKRFLWKMERIAPPTSTEKEAVSEDGKSLID